ncbi:MAG: FecR domain-containing protein [Candidatus Competibacteraceae bacterium]|jgi:Flp pilus assembly protein TadD|nr:FecR domain-containing protein [Candidatus Competibacteraceae bacterium]
MDIGQIFNRLVRNNLSHFVLLVWSVFALGFLGADRSMAEEQACTTAAAQLVAAQGEVAIKRAGQEDWQAVPADQTGQALCAGDSVRTGPRSRATVQAPAAETTASIDENTVLTITVTAAEQSFWLRLLKGAIYFFSRTPQDLTIETPYANAAIEGTEFLVRVETGQTSVLVFEGLVKASNSAGSFMAGSGEAALAKAGQAPRRLLISNPQQAVQWALYYPPIIAYPARQLQNSDPAVLQAQERFWANDLPAAFALLDEVPQQQRDLRYWNVRASLLLSVGRVEEARAAINQALNLDQTDGAALALQATIVITQNDREQGLKLAQQAVEQAPRTAAPRIALSYAKQAVFELDAAQENAAEATRLESDNALAWARLAELQLMQGNLHAALASAQQAVALNPRLGQTQTILGFAYLTRLEIAEARTRFEEAIQLEPAAPLPRLGLGLALIRRDEMVEGRRQIEIAVGLDPNQSLLRSYLGKAYYEEKRDDPAATQYQLAKELDPNDPTPWFYEAILKQTQNRPVEALQDIQKSIELNDNRAVYRSRQLLDQDEASRSTTQGRIYQDLGFEQLALREGWKSVNTDPGDYSGHRLLADSYLALPRHELARSSELLQAQLLQPLNLTPIQPQLAVSDLGILSGSGPSSLSLNEYNTLFVSDGLALQANGVGGNRGTLGNDLVISGLKDRFSYSLGQFHYETDGFNDNSDQEIDVYNAFVQITPIYGTSLQAEYRYIDREQGEVNQRLDPDDLLEDFDNSEKTKVARIGLRHDWLQNATLLGSLIYTDQESAAEIPLPIANIAFDTESEIYTLDLQQLFDLKQVKLISGMSYTDRDSTQVTTSTGPSFTNIQSTERDAEYINFYLYSYLRPNPDITLTLGASGDRFDGNISSKDQFNPKLGFSWSLTERTTFRVAAFRNLKKIFSAASQTLEPTQIAGFAQFFNENDATDSWTYGFAADQSIIPSLDVGISWSQRQLEQPIQITSAMRGAQQTIILNNEEQIGRAYLYWTPKPWLALSGEYFYERFDNDDDPLFQSRFAYTDLKTHRLKLSGRVFKRSGFSGGLSASYIRQSGVTVDNPTSPFDLPPTIKLREDFWLIDGFLSYRLPQRWGIISLEVKNLFDEKFNYEEGDPANPLFYPGRLVLGKFSLSF